MGQALARHLEIPYVGRDEFPSTPPFLQRLSPQYMRQYLLLPSAVEDGVLVVACAEPDRPDRSSDDLRGALGMDVRLAVATETTIVEAIERYFGAGSTAVQKVIETMGDDDRGDDAGSEDLTLAPRHGVRCPVVRLVNLLIENAIKANASDVHIEPFEDSLRVRYRIDGVLFDAETPPKRLRAAITSRIKIMAELEHRRAPPAAGRAHPHGPRGPAARPPRVDDPHASRRERRHADPGPGGDPDAARHLGFEERNRRSIERIIGLPHGMLLVTGPTGSGKTTTLYAALDKINSPARRSSPSRTRSSTSCAASTRSTSSRRSD